MWGKGHSFERRRALAKERDGSRPWAPIMSLNCKPDITCKCSHSARHYMSPCAYAMLISFHPLVPLTVAHNVHADDGIAEHP